MIATVRASGRLRATTDPASIAGAEHVIVVVGTPVDRYQSPDIDAVSRAIEPLTQHLVRGQLVVLRSTVYPGVTQRVARLITRLERDIDVSFCPERIAEGHALDELHDLPQIISGTTPRGTQRASALFRHLTTEIVEPPGLSGITCGAAVPMVLPCRPCGVVIGESGLTSTFMMSGAAS